MPFSPISAICCFLPSALFISSPLSKPPTLTTRRLPSSAASSPSSPPSPPAAASSTAPISPRLRHFLTSAQEGDPLTALSRADAAFTRLKARNTHAPIPSPIVHVSHIPVASAPPDFDVLVAGGTLGVIYATALQRRGWRVALIERGLLAGRTQEWNISRAELAPLLREQVLDSAQLHAAIVTECTVPGRVAFATRNAAPRELAVPRVLNVGVAPDILVRETAKNFRAAGGVVLDLAKVLRVDVAPDAVRVHLSLQKSQAVKGNLGAGGTGLRGQDTGETTQVTARVLMDAMGSFSPIAEQARAGTKPDSVCIVVGACMKGKWLQNESPDLIYSFQPITQVRSSQYFWEAFPVQREPDCRTTYMFAYGACDERRQTLTETMEDYVDSVRQYQDISLDDMQVKRVLFGFFPSYYKESPADVKWDRILPVGDAGGLQSPISFGGFGCTLRHLTRITNALDEALMVKDDSLLVRQQLQNLQSYLPSLSITRLFNRAMSVQPGQTTAGPFLDEFGINDMLWLNMKVMADLGEDVQLSFLQDVVKPAELTKTLVAMTIRNPELAVKMSAFLGAREIFIWSRHYAALLGFAAALPVLKLWKRVAQNYDFFGPAQRFWINRAVDAATYGSGADFDAHH